MKFSPSIEIRSSYDKWWLPPDPYESMKQTKQPLAELLRTARSGVGLSQRQVAENLGYQTTQFVSNWERGRSVPPGHILRKIAEIYNIQLEVLYLHLRSQAVSRLKKALYQEVFGSE